MTAADPTTKSLTVDAGGAKHGGQEKANQKDGSNPQVTVDATAELIVKGAAPTALAPGATPRPVAFPAVGDEIVTVGPPGSAPDSLIASLVVDFHRPRTSPSKTNSKSKTITSRFSQARTRAASNFTAL